MFTKNWIVCQIVWSYHCFSCRNYICQYCTSFFSLALRCLTMRPSNMHISLVDTVCRSCLQQRMIQVEDLFQFAQCMLWKTCSNSHNARFEKGAHAKKKHGFPNARLEPQNDVRCVFCNGSLYTGISEENGNHLWHGIAFPPSRWILNM